MTVDEVFALLEGDPLAYVAWQHRVGAEEATRQINQAAMAVMVARGPRAVFEVTERVRDMTARLEEFDAA